MERTLAHKLSTAGRVPLTKEELEAVAGAGTWTQADFCGNEYDLGRYDD